MNVLPLAKQAAVIRLLVEGNSIRSTSRLTGVHVCTIMRLLLIAAEKCRRLQERRLQNIPARSVEFDELWSFVGKKQKNVQPFSISQYVGDQYVFIALESTTKLIIGHHVGKRNYDNTLLFLRDVHGRLALSRRLRLHSDGFSPYTVAMREVFGLNVPYGQVVKIYKSNGRLLEVKLTPMHGIPKSISTTFVERSNLTLRTCVKRLARKTNAFSKKLENHRAAICLFVTYYNFCRIHQSLDMTPAMAAGLMPNALSVEELLTLN